MEYQNITLVFNLNPFYWGLHHYVMQLFSEFSCVLGYQHYWVDKYTMMAHETYIDDISKVPNIEQYGISWFYAMVIRCEPCPDVAYILWLILEHNKNINKWNRIYELEVNFLNDRM